MYADMILRVFFDHVYTYTYTNTRKHTPTTGLRRAHHMAEAATCIAADYAAEREYYCYLKNFKKNVIIIKR